jgi:hypothetical protein
MKNQVLEYTAVHSQLRNCVFVDVYTKDGLLFNFEIRTKEELVTEAFVEQEIKNRVQLEHEYTLIRKGTIKRYDDIAVAPSSVVEPKSTGSSSEFSAPDYPLSSDTATFYLFAGSLVCERFKNKEYHLIKPEEFALGCYDPMSDDYGQVGDLLATFAGWEQFEDVSVGDFKVLLDIQNSKSHTQDGYTEIAINPIELATNLAHNRTLYESGDICNNEDDMYNDDGEYTDEIQERFSQWYDYYLGEIGKFKIK